MAIKDNKRLKRTRSLYAVSRQGWANLLPQRTPAAAFQGNARAPWVVIGAGFTGLACARRLAAINPDHEIILLEARELAQNASGRNSGYGVAVSDFGDHFAPGKIGDYQRINRINHAGLAHLRDLVRDHDIDCQWRENGIYRAAADQHALRGLEEFYDYLSALNIAHDPLDGAQLAAELGTAHYRAGLKIHDGALLQPASLVFGLADALPQNVTLYENTPVLHMDSGRTIKLDVPGGQIEADQIALATNFEAPNLGVLRARLLGSTLSASCTRVLTDDEFATLGRQSAWGVLSLHSGGATVQLTADRRLAIRNTAEFNGGALLSPGKLKQRQQIHRRAFDLRFAQFAHVPFEQSWSCVEGISLNGTSFFGKTGANIYYAGGYNGSGITRGTAFGTALADWASNITTSLIADCLASPPAHILPPRPILDVGAWLTIAKRFRGVGKDR